MDDDALIARLRERAADPLRRRDARPTRFDHAGGGMSAGELQLGVESAAQSLEAWLCGWLDAAPACPPPVAMLHDSMVAAARTARAHIAAMTPQQRVQIGLPEQGWERVVWGGLGLEPDQPDGAA
jgi:hypothetical protein